MPKSEHELITMLNASARQLEAVTEQVRAVTDAVRKNAAALLATVGDLEARLDKIEDLEIAKAK